MKGCRVSRVLVVVVLLGVWIYTLVDLGRTPGAQVRVLPKWLWLVLVILLGVLAVPLWFLLGRPREGYPPPGGGGGGGGGGLGAGPRPPRPLAPDDDPDFLKRLDEQSWSARMERLCRERDRPAKDPDAPGSGPADADPAGPPSGRSH